MWDIPNHSHPSHMGNTNTGTRTNLIQVGVDPIPTSTLEVQPKEAPEAPWEHLDGRGITAGIMLEFLGSEPQSQHGAGASTGSRLAPIPRNSPSGRAAGGQSTQKSVPWIKSQELFLGKSGMLGRCKECGRSRISPLEAHLNPGENPGIIPSLPRRFQPGLGSQEAPWIIP